MSFIKTTGYDKLDAMEAPKTSGPGTGGKLWRFRMKEGETKKLIFLTDDPPIIEEHQLKIDGNWGNYFTCLKNLGKPCPLCDAGDRPSTTGFYVVIDRTEFTRRDNTKGKDSIRVLAAKFKSLKQFKKFSTKYRGLVGVEFEVERSSGKSPSIGDMYIKEDDHDEAEMLEIINGGRPANMQVTSIDDIVPDWEEYLAPKTEAELAVVAGGKANEADEDDGTINFN